MIIKVYAVTLRFFMVFIILCRPRFRLTIHVHKVALLGDLTGRDTLLWIFYVILFCVCYQHKKMKKLQFFLLVVIFQLRIPE